MKKKNASSYQHAMSKANPKMPIAVQQQTPKSAGAAGAGAAVEWTVGALCTAKYAADGKFYPAQVVEVTPKGVKVSFTEYENEFQVCAAKDLKVFVVKTGPAKAAAPKVAPLSPKQGPKAAPLSPKQGAKAASPSLGPMKSGSPRGSPKFSPVDPVKQAPAPPTLFFAAVFDSHTRSRRHLPFSSLPCSRTPLL
jgi:hypothetical protein